MTLNAKIGGFMDFFAILRCDTRLYHSQGGATLLSLCDPDKRIWYLYINLAWTGTAVGFARLVDISSDFLFNQAGLILDPLMNDEG